MQIIRNNVRIVLNVIEVNTIESSSRFDRLSNKPANKALSKPSLSTGKHHKIQLTEINKPTNKNNI